MSTYILDIMSLRRSLHLNISNINKLFLIDKHTIVWQRFKLSLKALCTIWSFFDGHFWVIFRRSQTIEGVFVKFHTGSFFVRPLRHMWPGRLRRVTPFLILAISSEFQNFKDEVIIFVLNLPFFVKIFFEIIRSQMGKFWGWRLLLVDHALDVEKGV